MSQHSTSFLVFEEERLRPSERKKSSLINKPKNIPRFFFFFPLLKPSCTIQAETESNGLRSSASNVGNNYVALKVGVQQHKQPVEAAFFN